MNVMPLGKWLNNERRNIIIEDKTMKTMWIVDAWCNEVNDWVAVNMHEHKLQALWETILLESRDEVARMYMHMTNEV